MSSNFTTFGQSSDTSAVSVANVSASPVAREIPNPYDNPLCPKDIQGYLLPDGSKFGLFSDPYATMLYSDPQLGLKNGRYWIHQYESGNDVSPYEVKILETLATQRVMTRKQLERILFPYIGQEDRTGNVFLKRCRKKGIITAFSWNTPIKDERIKPLVYGLTKHGADASEMILQRKLSRDEWFLPVSYTAGTGPEMTQYFNDLVTNELFVELTRIDRLISWKRRPRIQVENQAFHIPAASFEAIKDQGEIYSFWVEVFRPQLHFEKKVAERFYRLRDVYNALAPDERPIRIIMIADGDARIAQLDKIAKVAIPGVPIRYTTDERLLAGIGPETFLEYNHEKQALSISRISFLQEDAPGMTAREYRIALNDYNDDEFEE